MRRWKPQSHHGEGGNHGVNMGRWKPESPWEGGNHRVTIGG